MTSIVKIWVFQRYPEIVLDYSPYFCVNKMFTGMEFHKFMSKAQLADKLGISRETLRLRLKQIQGLNTGRRQLLYPKELFVIFKEFEKDQ